jgi:hypothetical protein
MTAKLNVLVLESDRGAADGAREELAAAGHVALRCHEPGSPAFPCNALVQGQRCPLDAADVDVALDVRARPRSQPAAQEDGVACALRHHIPVVVAGATVLNPYDSYPVETLGRTYDVVAACEHASNAPLPEHTAVAGRMLRQVLDLRDIPAEPVVTVTRRHGALVAELERGEHVDDATKSMVSVRLTAALRQLDRHARGIDVVFHDH